MFVRARLLPPAVIAISLLAFTTLASQSPQYRAGFWLGAGFGVGGFVWQCDGCSHESHGASRLSFRFGWTPTKNLLLGLEGNGTAIEAGENAGYAAFTAYWYPNAARGLFVKAGVGPGVFVRKTSTARAESWSGALVVGAGYDFRVGRKISITPVLSIWRSTRATLSTDSSTLETGLRHAGATLDVGVTFHSLFGGKNPPVEHPQTRRGFWLGFGFGGANIAWQCDGCSNQNRGAASFFLGLGATVSKKVLLGAELTTAAPGFPLGEPIGPPDSLLEEVRVTHVALTAYWYPGAAGGFFLKGGVGASRFLQTTDGAGLTSSAGAILVGTGYDIRVGSMVSVTPMLTLWGSTKADLKDGSTTVATGLRHAGATFLLGITFH